MQMDTIPSEGVQFGTISQTVNTVTVPSPGKCFKVDTLCKVIVTEKTILPELIQLGWYTEATSKRLQRLLQVNVINLTLLVTNTIGR